MQSNQILTRTPDCTGDMRKCVEGHVGLLHQAFKGSEYNQSLLLTLCAKGVDLRTG